MLRMPLSHPEMKNGEIGLYYDGTWLRLVKNDEVLNENNGHDCFMPSCPFFVHPSFADAAVAVADRVPLSYLLRRSRKMDNTVIDAEIAGRRTIVSR